MCTSCDKELSDKINLNDHVRTHTGEKPLQCDKNEKPFLDKSMLMGHLRTLTGGK